jgi:hypothetical protein
MRATPEDIQRAYDWYMAEEERSLLDTAGEFGVSPDTPRAWFERAGLPRKPRYRKRSAYNMPATAAVASNGDGVAHVKQRNSFRHHRRRGWR